MKAIHIIERRQLINLGLNDTLLVVGVALRNIQEVHLHANHTLTVCARSVNKVILCAPNLV